MVQEDDDLRALTISVEGKVMEVISIDERVEGEGAFWEPEPVWKMHFQVAVGDLQEYEDWGVVSSRQALRSCKTQTINGFYRSQDRYG